MTALHHRSPALSVRHISMTGNRLITFTENRELIARVVAIKRERYADAVRVTVEEEEL
jgi:hypothetical protein